MCCCCVNNSLSCSGFRCFFSSLALPWFSCSHSRNPPRPCPLLHLVQRCPRKFVIRTPCWASQQCLRPVSCLALRVFTLRSCSNTRRRRSTCAMFNSASLASSLASALRSTMMPHRSASCLSVTRFAAQVSYSCLSTVSGCLFLYLSMVISYSFKCAT